MSHETRKFRATNLEARAEKAATESTRAHEAAHRAVEHIPFGQPILVGHHSEGRHRAALRRCDSNMRKSIEAQDRADELSRRARAAQNNTAIYGDDPEAVQKLREKVANLEKSQATMVEANRLIRAKDEAGLLALLGEKNAGIAKAQGGFPSYALSNNNANIHTARRRLAEAEAKAKAEPKTEQHDGVRVEECPEDDRIRLIFDGKPDEETRSKLKGLGFRWSPSAGAWQRNLNNAGRYAVKRFLEEQA